MDNLLSIVTFLPLIAAVILAVFLRGDDAAAQLNAKRLALAATSATFLISLELIDLASPEHGCTTHFCPAVSSMMRPGS